MQKYRNYSGNSGVSGFEFQEEAILVEFNQQDIYKYTFSSAGEKHVLEMKRLAIAGKGLSTYISRNVKKKYAQIIPQK
ncbi:hypothetical protein [Salinimicrobium sp. GXAS 041]|uniref:hypothetical protein n=1 Tax=Salinimicrobium sp. GXAS 041 TaxID=3400806 RepID=UPI003C765B26